MANLERAHVRMDIPMCIVGSSATRTIVNDLASGYALNYVNMPYILSKENEYTPSVHRALKTYLKFSTVVILCFVVWENKKCNRAKTKNAKENLSQNRSSQWNIETYIVLYFGGHTSVQRRSKWQERDMYQ